MVDSDGCGIRRATSVISVHISCLHFPQPLTESNGFQIYLSVLRSQIKGKESENSYQELKRSPKDRHTQTHGNCIEIFQQAQPSFSI